MATNGLLILVMCLVIQFIKPSVRPYAERGLLWSVSYMVLCLSYTAGFHVGVGLVVWGLWSEVTR